MSKNCVPKYIISQSISLFICSLQCLELCSKSQSLSHSVNDIVTYSALCRLCLGSKWELLNLFVCTFPTGDDYNLIVRFTWSCYSDAQLYYRIVRRYSTIDLNKVAQTNRSEVPAPKLSSMILLLILIFLTWLAAHVMVIS